MKKLLLLALIPAIWASCNSNDDNNTADDRGSIIINSGLSVDVDNMMTRTSTNVEDLTLTLKGPDGKESSMKYPTGGAVKNLATGDYTLKLTSHPNGFTPGFDNPVYETTATVKVERNVDKPVKMTCTQVNSGVFFTYDDESLTAAGLGSVVATVKQGEASLEYSGDKREAQGYFEPGEVTVSFMNGSNPVTIGGAASKTITVAAKELWKITIKASAADPENGLFGAPGAAGAQIVVTLDGLDW